jgi:exonuclease 3'-5' domain-containing protein 2
MPLLYSNCVLKTPSGVVFGRCSQKRFDWYLKKDLGKKVDDKTIVLNFEPKFKGAIKPYDVSYKENKCVVCGEDDHEYLHRYNIVPHEFKKWFPAPKKNHRMQDIVLLCFDCQDDLNIILAKFNKELFDKYDIKYDKDLNRIKGLIKKLSNDKVPEKVREKTLQEIKLFVGKEVTAETLKELEEKRCYNFADAETPYEHIAKRVVAEDCIDSFMESWKTCFVDNMKPKYLPDGWA